MIGLKIAFKNLFRHKLSFLIMALIFTLCSFALFWVFGWGNAMGDAARDYIRNSRGDLCFSTEYFQGNQLKPFFVSGQSYRLVLESRILCMLDSPKRSEVLNVREITPFNRNRLKRYIRPTQGRLPRRINEIVIPEFRSDVFRIGDTIYLSTSTPGKVLNTICFTIVGKNKVDYALVTRDSMNAILNSKTDHNFIYAVLNDRNADEDQVNETARRIKRVLCDRGIDIRKTSTVYSEMERMGYIAILLPALKVLMMLILFPLAGAAVAAIVWIFSLKRRREIWTYVALGWKDRKIIRVITYELWLAALAGLSIGLALGWVSAALIEEQNVWLQFSYTFAFPLWAKIHIGDIGAIFVFAMASVSIWLHPPLQKVIKAKPFSY